MRSASTLSAIAIDLGDEHVRLELSHARLVESKSQAPPTPLTNVRAALRAALDKPNGFPPLRAALTPDDHIALAIDSRLPHVDELGNGLLEYLSAASVPASAVTVILPAGSSAEAIDWRADGARLKVEVHDPADRHRLSYLATTRHGRRIYLNRAAVDADQLIVLSGRSYDPLLGYSGAEGAIYPGLADDAARRDALGHVSMAAPGGKAWPLKRQAAEVSWLLGTPFIVHAIEGRGNSLAHLIGGTVEASGRAEALLDECWRTEVAEPVDAVIAAVGGPPEADFADLARALACAARVVKPGGRIIVLSRAAPDLGPAGELLRRADEPAQALEWLEQEAPQDGPAAHLWVRAVQRASVYLLSGLPPDTAEDLFTVPLDSSAQVSRLVKPGETCLVVPDSEKTLAVLAPRAGG